MSFEAPAPNRKWKTCRTRDEAKAYVFDYIERFYNPKKSGVGVHFVVIVVDTPLPKRRRQIVSALILYPQIMSTLTPYLLQQRYSA